MDTDFRMDSKNNIDKMRSFINNIQSTWQGFNKSDLIKCISFESTEIMDWPHVTFTIDLELLQPISGSKLEELIIPPFVEELRSSGDKYKGQFGYNSTFKNRIKHIDMYNDVRVIDPYTFSLYNELNYIRLSNNLIYIGDGAFSYCNSLHQIDLSNCEYIGDIQEGWFKGTDIKKLITSKNK